MPEIEIENDNTEFTLIHSKETPWDLTVRLEFDEDTREIHIYDTIENNLGNWFFKVHNHLVHLDGKRPITIHLNSEGGDVQSMFEFIDIVRGSKVPIHVIAQGNVCSAAVLMLACAQKRSVSKHCVMMVHQYSHDGGPSGLRYTDAKDRRAWEDWTHTKMIGLMAEFSSNEEKDVKYWTKIFEKKGEHWLLGGQAIIDEGLADEVLPF